MESLIQSGLYRNGLVQISNPLLVRRYNHCLEAIGFESTNLNEFQIDAWGWSPQIAEEKEDPFYLSHGFANPYGIIISPLQLDRSVHFPFHSFDKYVVRNFSRKYQNQIKEITKGSAIYFEVDQEISAYTAPQDLLMIDAIRVAFHSAEGLLKAANKQRSLVRNFYEQENAWANETLIDELIESAKKHGDLRFRSLELPEYPYTDLRNFFCRAFGGLYIFRDLPSGKPLLIFEQNNSKVSGKSEFGHIEFNAQDPSLIGYLFSENLLESDPSFFLHHKDFLERIRDGILMDAMASHMPEIDVPPTDDLQRNKYIAHLHKKNALNDLYFELDRLLLKINKGSSLKLSQLSGSAQTLFCYPAKHLGYELKELLWELLTKKDGLDPAMMYTFAEEDFYKMYNTWPTIKKRWALEVVSKNRFLYNLLIYGK